MLFCGWCRGRDVASVNATISLIVDFLVQLRCDKGLSVSAVKGYRSALNLVFALKGMDLAASREISMLITSFSKSARPEELRPRVGRRFSKLKQPDSKLPSLFSQLPTVNSYKGNAALVNVQVSITGINKKRNIVLISAH